jgi:hypothetical protein
VDESAETVAAFVKIIKEGDVSKLEAALTDEIIGDPVLMSKILYHACVLNSLPIVKFFLQKKFNLNRFVEDFRFRYFRMFFGGLICEERFCIVLRSMGMMVW